MSGTESISPDEFKALMANSEGHINGIIAMGYYTGMRRGEILNLTWNKVDFDKHMTPTPPSANWKAISQMVTILVTKWVF